MSARFNPGFYPVVADTKRPFRLWDSEAKRPVRWANFKSLRNAHNRALCEAAWSKGNTVLEVFDITTGALRGQYKRVGGKVSFWRSHHHVAEEKS